MLYVRLFVILLLLPSQTRPNFSLQVPLFDARIIWKLTPFIKQLLTTIIFAFLNA